MGSGVSIGAGVPTGAGVIISIAVGTGVTGARVGLPVGSSLGLHTSIYLQAALGVSLSLGFGKYPSSVQQSTAVA